MHDILTIFLILLVLLLIISTLGGSIRFNENFEEQAVDAVLEKPEYTSPDPVVPPPQPTKKIEEPSPPSIPTLPRPPVDTSIAGGIEPFENGVVSFASIH